MAKIQNMSGEEVAEPAGEAQPVAFNFDAAVAVTPEIEGIEAEIDVIMEAAKKKAAPLRERIKALYKGAAENDVTRKVLRHVIGQRRATRKAAERFARLGAEHQGNAEQLSFDLQEAEQDNTEAA